MSYENEIKHLMRELKFAKSDYLNARLNSEDALMRHALKTDVETIEFQIDVFEKAGKADEYEAKAKAFDAISYIIKKRANDDFSSVNNDYEAGILRAYEVMECNVDDFYRGEYDAKK